MPDYILFGSRAPSNECENFIKDFEKFKAKAYLPTPNDKPTIGWGSTGPDIHLGMVWTLDQANARFIQVLYDIANDLDTAIGDHPTTQNEFDAMCSLAYNIGFTNFAHSHLLMYHNLGKFDLAAQEFPKWDHQNGKVLDGLLTRRKKEQQVYINGWQ